MSIIKKVLAKKEIMLASDAEAADNQRLAQAAIIGGIQSEAWQTYMRQFVDKDDNGIENEDQLMRLFGTDGSDSLDRNRAYLVANGMCGSFTRLHFEENVRSIDENLEGGCDQ